MSLQHQCDGALLMHGHEPQLPGCCRGISILKPYIFESFTYSTSISPNDMISTKLGQPALAIPRAPVHSCLASELWPGAQNV